MRVANENKNLFQHYHNHNKVYHYCMFSKISRIKLIFSQIENLCDVEKSRKIFKFNNFAIKIVKYWVMNRSIILHYYDIFYFQSLHDIYFDIETCILLGIIFFLLNWCWQFDKIAKGISFPSLNCEKTKKY